MWRWFWRLIWLPELIFSQTRDTTGGREYALPPLFIEAERSLRQKRWGVDSLGWLAVGEHLSALLAQTEGVYLRDYGGQGGLKTLSVRGMGAALTAISFQGLPLRAPTLGIVNLAPFFLPGLHHVTFTPGGNLTLSPGAIGILSLSWHPTQHRRAFGWRTAQYGEIMGYVLHETPSSLFQLSGLSALNRYPFTVPERGWRENADYRYLQSTWAYRRGPWQVTGWGYASGQFIPPPVLVGAAGGPAEQLRQQLLAHTLEVLVPHGSLRLQHLWELVNHTDAFQQQGKSHLHTVQLQLQQAWGDASFLAGYSLYFASDHVRSNRTALGYMPLPSLGQQEGALTAFLQWQKPSTYFRAEGRLTSLTRFSLQTSFLLRTGWRAIGIEIMRGIRFPSLWERYWIGYGNPSLPPEQSHQVQAFVEKALRRWHLYLAGFWTQTRNRIVTVPLSPVRWQAYSLGYVESIGAEGRLEYRASHLQTWLAGTLLSAREYSFTDGGPLPYTPPYLLSGGIMYARKRYRLLYQTQYVSWRTSSLTLSRYTLLAPYHLHGISFAYVGKGWRVEIGAENLLQASYQVIQGYPMPPRSFFIRWERR
ncbi:MAG: TonB-dependent receptor [Bacteroidia bacterium]|nr:TonB-dependent receptor [Bacteroidia bacterium]MDW8057536.1 TonB-dependent receptor [Bacteroidia bacterium]